MKYSFKGLSDKEILESRKTHGNNELTPQKVENFWDKLKDNFKDPIIIILCVALIIILVLSVFGLTEWYEAVAIAVAVLLATFISTFSEFKNESSFQKLQEEASRTKNNVFRNGQLSEVVINEIVKGDFVLLQSGDKIPADGKIIHGEIKVNQASLTGESENVTKTKAPDGYTLDSNDFTDLHWVFRGTVIDDGEAVLLVEAVGDSTFYGELAKELTETDDRLSPLQVKLKKLAKTISKFGYWGATFIAVAIVAKKFFIDNHFDPVQIAQYFQNVEVVVNDVLHAFVLSIIIIVAAVPEGLPMMIAIVLSLNMRKMLKAKVLVRKLLGIETAGSLNLLFTDKTGTITKGELEARLFIDGNHQQYDSYGAIPHALRRIFNFAVLENTACVITADGEAHGGNSSEQALVEYLDKEHRITKSETETEIEKNILFNSARKFSASQVKTKTDTIVPANTSITLIKGAPEKVLDACKTFYNKNGEKQNLEELNELKQRLDKLADTGIRLIAVATSKETIQDDNKLPGECTLVGVVGIRDEIRAESKDSITKALDAGVQVVMITGDREGTAVSIAKEIGLLRNDDDISLTSSELNKLSDEEIIEKIPRLRVIARALPTDKSRLVRLTENLGNVAGMTGDGVNDSAALKQADVGFAMGSGSEVAKEAGDIVILDDNFASITNAVRYGRTIFKSIRKFIVFQLTVNVAAVTTAFLGPFFGIDMPLTIIQILWINIIMDTLAALAFGGEPALQRYMKEKPVDRDESILTKDMKSAIFTIGLFVTAFSLFFLNCDPMKDWFVRDGARNQEVFLTAFFNLFIFMITFNSFNARTERCNLLENIGKNHGFLRIIGLIIALQVLFTYIGGTVLRTTPLQPKEWFIVIGMALIVIPLDLLRKCIRNLQKR